MECSLFIDCLKFTLLDLKYREKFYFQMCQAIEKVFQLAVATFNKAATTEASKKNLDMLVTQANKLRGTDVGLESCSVFKPSQINPRQKAPVTYIPVAENKHISVGIFVIQEGQNIPLHDHPHMHGVIKCLKGTLKINVSQNNKEAK